MSICFPRELAVVAGLSAMLMATSPVLAQATAAAPSGAKPIRLVVPLAAGGPTDAAARLLAEGLAQSSGRTVVVENKPGAATMLGVAEVALAAPDGDTIGIVSPSFTLHAAVGRKLPYRQQDLSGVMLIGSAPMVLVAPAAAPFSDARQLLAHARGAPGKLTYGSFGVGSSTHLFGELLQRQSGIRLVHIPFKGSSQALPELLAGRLDLWVDAVPSVAPYIRSGQLKVIGATGRQRLPALADVPSIPEIVPGTEMDTWLGVVTRAGTPQALIDRLQSQMAAGLASAGMKERMTAAVGIVPVGESAAAFDALIAAEIAKWREVVRLAGVRIDE